MQMHRIVTSKYDPLSQKAKMVLIGEIKWGMHHPFALLAY